MELNKEGINYIIKKLSEGLYEKEEAIKNFQKVYMKKKKLSA